MNNKYDITILTPTYNRANYLLQLYDSLKNQTCLKFKWLIVDDGSTDETKEIVKNFINENIIQIEYLYKDNGGKHTALNLGFKTIDTPLTFVVDSDDVLTNFAIETILMDINKIQSNQYVGLCYLRGFDYNNVIGDEFLHEGYDNLNKVRYIDNVSGDKAEIWKTDYVKKFQFPEYEGEKFIGEHYIWCQLSEKYDMYFSNKIIYITEYLTSGLTKSGRRMRLKNSKGGKSGSLIMTKNIYPLKIRIKNALLYVCYSFFDQDTIVEITKNSRLIVWICILPGYLLFKLWKIKYGEKG